MIKMKPSARQLLAIAAAMAFSQGALAQDAGRGKAVFEQCAACHSLEPGHNELGPHLKGLIGRKTASVEDFIYSPAMRRANVTWTPETLDAYLKDPAGATLPRQPHAVRRHPRRASPGRPHRLFASG